MTKSTSTEDSPTFIGLRGKMLQNTVSLMASVGFLLFGYDQGVMGSLLTLDSFKKTFPSIDTSRHSDAATMQGFTIAVYEIGCLFGALSTMGYGDKIGRRKCIFIGCAIMIVGAVLQCSAFTVGHLIVGRIVTGVGNGINTSTIPMWQAECSRPEGRGRLVMISGALITGGIAFSYWVDFGFYFTSGPISWRFPVAFQLIFPILIMPFILRFPESPRWLIKKSRLDDARLVFAALDGTPVDHPEVKSQLRDVQKSLEEEHIAGGDSFNFKRLFSQGEHRDFHRLMLGLWAQIFQQISGVNLIVYYAGTIFENYIGMTALNSRILAACNGTAFFLAAWIAFIFIDNIGRRKLMLFGLVGQTLSMAMLTVTTWESENKGNTGAAIGAAVLLFVYNTFFGIGWLGMGWLYPAEVPPLSIRAPANAISTAGNWSFNFLVVMITPVAFESIKSFTYLIFAALNLLMIPAVYFLFPETAGRSLEDLDAIFAQCNPWKPWTIVKIASRHPETKAKVVTADSLLEQGKVEAEMYEDSEDVS
ncbi:hypothetical protein KL906_003540 [Ogataea polymorpha]|uniref:Major facilitator superfamily (MFS) profile domain-containing protein n=1 Tax=Ogataea polymorpha TaxID=460523 RepID=A0A9P8SXG7_9ASCO|nr:hypothetical protein KL906_003540 [Ogataea polymorpha]KAG7916706.1 hypothetical protein KL927_003345 [Ogataea polymorpha]KAH3659058.1 hypothetical protein OGATHE_006784 [Ogataea polymorpha]